MGVRPAAAARLDRRHGVDRPGGGGGAGGNGGRGRPARLSASGGAGVGGRCAGRGRVGGRSGGECRAGRNAEPLRPCAAAGARCGRKTEARRGGGRQERTAGPPDARRPGPGAGSAGRPRAPARRRALRAEGRHRRRLPAGTGAAPWVALARGPAHDDRAARRPHRAGGARPPRPEPVAAPGAHRHPGGGGRIQARFGVEGAGRARTRPRYGGAGRRDPRPRDSDSGGDRGGDAATGTPFPAIARARHGVCRRHHSDSGAGGRADAAPEAGLGGSADPARSDGPTSRCPHDAGRHHFDARSRALRAARFRRR